MNDAEREKRLDKIRKCLRLSKSAEPHEAAAALRHAQAMMRELGIEDESEVGLEQTTGEVIITKEAFGGCQYLVFLTNLIKSSFGVDCLWEAGNGISRIRANIRYIGPRSRVLMAVYAHRVVDRAVYHAWQKVRHMFDQEPGSRQTFRLSFLLQIEDKVTKFHYSDPEKAASERYIKVLTKGGELEPVKARSQKAHDPLAARLGFMAGSEFDIHRPMDADKLRIGHDS